MNYLSRALQSLPPLSPPEDGWQRLSRSLDARAARPRRRARLIGGMALAASVLLAVLLLRPMLGSAPAPTAVTAGDDTVAGLMQQSQALEQQLVRLKAEAGVWDGALARDSARLQRDVALLDLQISDVAFNPQADRRAAEVLWQHRVGLLNQLVSAHAAPTLVRSTASPAALDADENAILEL